MTKIKICGIKTLEDIELVNELKPDYAGFVLFFPKSRRCISTEKAKKLLEKLDSEIKSVAVTVSPTSEQIKTAKECGFDMIQIHGNVCNDIIRNSSLPVLRAFNVSNIEEFDRYKSFDNISGYVFDAQTPGSGKTFDWSALKNIPRDGKLFFLAGGLNPDNISDAIKLMRPDVVDVSSGVERDDGEGKDREKAYQFVSAVKSNEV